MISWVVVEIVVVDAVVVVSVIVVLLAVVVVSVTVVLVAVTVLVAGGVVVPTNTCHPVVEAKRTWAVRDSAPPHSKYATWMVYVRPATRRMLLLMLQSP